MIKDFEKKVSVEKIESILKGKGYEFFSKGDYNLNIIGFRNPNLVANKFDDTLGLFYKVDGKWVVKAYPITTDAGTYWLQNPMDIRGTASQTQNV